MGVLKLTNPVNPEFESEVTGSQVSVDDFFLVRPCERYQELLKSCKSLRGRLHQYYVYGELFDCGENKKNFEDCLFYRKTKDPSALKGIIEWEKAMIDKRMKATLCNPVWEPREKPPEDFQAPLPEFIQKRQSWYMFPKSSF